ncbi:hypothetical protein IW147_002243 [Coemansia sp. RSA 720]|nr:hypothetical protein IW147_002243 [Coemansia sp. RSA 720]
MEAPGTFVRKHSVQGAKWKPAYLSRLHEYVADVNYLTSHAYAFARFILLHEVDIEDSIIFQQFGTSFFYDVFLSCAERENEQEAGVEAQVRRAVILSYRNEYKRLSGLMLRKYEPLSQVASYVSKTMLTDYKNNVMLRFGETWRRAINLKLDSKNKMVKFVERLKSKGRSEEEIREQCQAQIWSPARHAKQVLCLRWPVATTAEEQTIIDFVTLVLKPATDKQPVMSPNEPAMLPDEPAVLPDEPAVLPDEPAVLPDEPATSSKEPATSPKEPAAPARYWEQVVDLKMKSFKDHPQHVFTGFIMTDGISISVIRKNKEKLAAKVVNQKRKREEQAQQEQPAAQRAWLAAQPMVQPMVQLLVQQEQQPWIQVVQQAQEAWQARQAQLSTEQAWQECLFAEQAWHVLLSAQPVQSAQLLVKKAKQRRPAQPRQQADCAYIDDLPQATLQSTAGRCVLVDPGRRDLLFMMHEDSSIKEKRVYRYTRNQQRKETRLTKFKQILEKVKPADVAEAERSLGAGSCVKPDLELYKLYLVARAQVADTLTHFYNKTYTVHPTSSHQIHMFKTSEPQSFPLHRKLRLSAYVNRKQADQRLIKKLQEEFEPNAVIVIGDWSAPMTRYHEPIRGKSWRTLLKRGGFDVYLIKEYLTSKTCPNCNGRLSNTRDVPNPRPWMRTKRLIVKCHGLLSCQSEKCLESIGKSKGKSKGESKGESEGESEGEKENEKESEKKDKVKQRWWNRDLAAVLNFRHILFSLRETGIAPARFQRGQQTGASMAPKARKTRKASTAPNPTNNLPAQL